jgi:DNA-binding NtrC family response regulator
MAAAMAGVVKSGGSIDGEEEGATLPLDDTDTTTDMPAAGGGVVDDATEADVPNENRTYKIETSQGTRHALVRRFRLAVLSGPDAGLEWSSSGDRLGAGTHASNDLVLHDRTVSRFHCAITIEAGRALVRDLGSRNGTVVDGVQVLHAALHDGAVLTLGHSRLRFDLGSDHVKIPLSDRPQFGLMVGNSASMRAVFFKLERAASSDASILLEGETGTGKEVAAESVHLESARRDGAFVVVDCGAIPPDLLESELFGHQKGAFTGAVASRTGAFKAASGGTIFLDEIGELSLDLQPKLLRALERREVKPVGGDYYEPIDVRVVAATNRNLRSEVNAQRFRHDLYYRLAVLQVRLPPLRERPEDMPLLVEHILRGLSVWETPEAERLSTEDFMRHLTAHSWPGNVRELRNYIERCLAMREQAPIVDEREPAVDSAGGTTELIIDTSQPLRLVREKYLREIERRYVAEMLRKHGGNVTAAARAAGMTRAFFYRLLSRSGVR